MSWKGILMSSSAASLPAPAGPGSVSGAPNLPAGFTDTFTSRYVDTGEVRLHAVIGGAGPPLLLVHGWPQTWYAWRMLMPALARDFSVVAPDQRGIGLSDKPSGGYDTATLAGDMVALMDGLGHHRFAMYGTDVGMPIAYALAADHPDRLDRLVVSEAPCRVCPLTAAVPSPLLNERLWHLAFNQLPKVNEQLVTGRGGHLLRRGVRRLGRDEQAARRRGQVLPHRHPRHRRRPPARQLRVLPRAPGQQRAERAAQDGG
jgi:pimeloyl-ACP methyl ester carboxylesterase